MSDKLVMTTNLGEGEKAIAVEIYERSQMVWVGSFMIPSVTECYFSISTPNWPKIQIRARRGIAKWWFKRGNQSGIMLDNEQFNELFKVTAKDEGFAIMLLSPELQSYILSKPTVDWSTSKGTLKLWYRGRLKKKRVGRAIERLMGFHALIADELFDWDSPRSHH